ncbi:UDP-N-acetylglucosamine 2-epimerase (non-hydrolyzing) [Achromobacter seleniivolatilans]|uniref:UDP-N-acetylglucosamine 2-epimerase (non-hydrolyzing) n=1 Tax=Achromobacter seleniivolatilans TaxID=3047478 RepID=A0ABY9MBG9_9BURK|nr:UDP-N-acetylglucosamine 2-epimerase (non-hydrolyzing) [Achromobacter sp. R39]WMD23548.1 UDP-N-acetylglucosamine 2-epimerase (non-hydrolyzing) [Achromobacter sp. R39]
MKVLSIFGTRPEAIKMAPLVHALQRDPQIQSVVCVTGQHREMLDQVLALFDLNAQHDLDIMVPNQTLNGLYARLISRVDGVLEAEQPDCVLVHGDTSTASACALASFHRRVRIGHVEAGLRTGNLAMPFPEEMNRRVVDAVGDWLFAPTSESRANLMRENLAGQITVTGNTVIDALAMTCAKLEPGSALARQLDARYDWLDTSRRLLLVTGHRRESFGDGFKNICAALATLARRDDLQIVYPVHLNPQVRNVVMTELAGLPNVHLIDPLDYLDFVWFMQRAYLILTDSGGVQEEAPYLGKPVLVMRDVTERPEAVRAGTVALVGTDTQRITIEVNRLLDDPGLHQSFSRRINPYGDGRASLRIVDTLCGRAVSEFDPYGSASPSPA